MKNIITNTLIAGISVMTLATGCVKETFPTSGATSGQIAESTTALQALVNAIPVNMTYPYSAFGSTNNYGFDFGYPAMLCATDAATGDVICTAGDDASGYDWFTYWQSGILLGPTQVVTPFFWNSHFVFVKACNDVILTVGEEAVTPVQQEALGAAKAIRANLYLDMARQYDPLDAEGYTIPEDIKSLTVPVIKETTSEDEARNNPRLTREEMFTFIFEELDDAEELLTLSGSSSKTLPSLAVVYGLKARAYLWLGGFDENYENIPTGNDAYKKAAEYAGLAISTSGCTISTESQWIDKKNGFNTATSAWMWYLPQSSEGLSNLVNFIAWRSNEATWGYGGRFVFEGTTSKFYERISSTDFRRKVFVGADPEAWYTQYGELTNYAHEDFSEKVPPYAQFKFHPKDGNISTYSVGNVTDIPLMRVEEMYLIQAEATAHYDAATGKSLLQEFMANRDPQYTVPAANDIVDEIIFQKRVELWGEGILFYDFKRLNMGIETGYTGTNAPSDCKFKTNGRAPWWNFCIPESEVNQNEALKNKNNPDPTNKIQPWIG